MTRRGSFLVKAAAVLGIVALLAAACGSDSEESTTTTEEGSAATTREADGTLTISTLLPFTGDLSSFGPGMRAAVELAVQDINAAGGVNDADVVLESNQDDGTDPDKASTGAEQIISDEKVDLVVGAAASGVSDAVIGKITGAGIAQCSPSNTAASLSDKEDNGLYFRTAPSDDLQGPALVDLVTGDGKQKIAVIARNDEYGKGFADAIETAVEETGGSLTAKVLYDPDAADLSADVDEVADSGQDATIVIGFVDDGAKIVSGLIEKGVAVDSMYTADGLKSDTFAAKVDPNNPGVVAGMKGTVPSAGDNEEFLSQVQALAADAQNTFVAQAYDCVVITALAATQTDSDSPSEFIKEVENVTKDGQECTTYAECKQLLENGTDIAYVGKAGELALVPPGDPSIANYDGWQFTSEGTTEDIPGVEIRIVKGGETASEDEGTTTTTAAE